MWNSTPLHQRYHLLLPKSLLVGQSTEGTASVTVSSVPSVGAATSGILPPEGLVFNAQADGRIDLSWGAVSNADSYAVWTGSSSSNLAEFSNQITNTNYLIDPTNDNLLYLAVKSEKSAV